MATSLLEAVEFVSGSALLLRDGEAEVMVLDLCEPLGNSQGSVVTQAVCLWNRSQAHLSLRLLHWC